MAMDLTKLRMLVFEKSGIKVDTDDPIFALVALNEAVLSECVEPHVAVLNGAADRLNAQTAQLLHASEQYRSLLQRLGEVSAAGGAPALADALADDQDDGARPQPAFETRRTHWNRLAAAVGVALLSAILTVSGQRMMTPTRASPPTAHATPPAAFTPEQLILMKKGERYNKMWAKLDTKTRARIQSLLPDEP